MVHKQFDCIVLGGGLIGLTAALALSKLDWYPRNNLEDMCKDGWNWKLLNLNNNSYETSNL